MVEFPTDNRGRRPAGGKGPMADGLAPMYRMPVSFGPAPGPRNLPAAHRHLLYRKDTLTLTLVARTDPAALQDLLPEGFSLDGEARLEVSLLLLENVGWLAGRGYNILLVRIPALWRGQEEVRGHFVPVAWESMTDPILTGRDELGWCKINAQIPPPVVQGGHWTAEALWEGFRFFELSAQGFADGPALPPQPMMFRKYVPATGRWGEAEIDYCTVTGETDAPPPQVHSAQIGEGNFRFRPARWEDMPTQYPIVNALAALPLEAFGPATLVRTSGGGNSAGQRKLA